LATTDSRASANPIFCISRKHAFPNALPKIIGKTGRATAVELTGA
jgi:ABC-type antimicrobial peptide transport system permease subunit